MYKLQVARVKLSNLISKSKFINTNQMSIHLFPVMHLYALQYHLTQGRIHWSCSVSVVMTLHFAQGSEVSKPDEQILTSPGVWTYVTVPVFTLEQSFWL